eukprot:c28732_g1_i1 orf=527-2284(+)
MEGNGLFELGNTDGLSSSSHGHGWQKVTNFKKQRREMRSKKPAAVAQPEIGKGKPSSDSTVFQALEEAAENRRVHREAMLAAGIAAPIELLPSDNESDGEEGHHTETTGIANGNVKKSKPKKPKKAKVSVAEAASGIDASELSAFLAEISDSFSSLPDVQLMRCADYFARAFSQVSHFQFGWAKILKDYSVEKAVEIPLCYLPENVSKIVSNWLSSMPAGAVSDFVLWALNDVINDMQIQNSSQKGSKVAVHSIPSKTKVAVLVLLAIVLRRRPDVLLQKAAVLRSSAQYQGQEKLAMMAWAYGQAAQGDVVVGMMLWVQNLLPMSVGKFGTPVSRDIALQFIESFVVSNIKKARPFLLNRVSQKGERLVPPVAFDAVMHAAFPSDTARTKATERFLEIYPLVKELALGGSQRSKSMNPVAQQLLPYSLVAASEDVSALSYEACDIFIWCLSQTSDCYKQWERLHLDNLKGSIQILNFLCCEWKDNVIRLTPVDSLKRTLQLLREKHSKMLEQVKGDAGLELLLKSADRHCKALLKKMSWAGACFKAMVTVITGVGMAYGLYMLNPNVNQWRWDSKLLLSKSVYF